MKSNLEVSAVIEGILVSFASREAATVDDVLALARSLPTALSEVACKPAVTTPEDESVTAYVLPPAVPLDQSVQEDTVTCLCCGKNFTMLKRHLKAEHGMTEEKYRTLYGLSDDHPLVAPSYSLRRAKYAKEIGLGKYARVPSEGSLGNPNA